MRDDSVFLSGRRLTTPPRLFLGATASAFVPPFDWRPLRLAKKIAAGADFIQTQYCFDVPRIQAFLRRVCDLGLHEQAYILVRVGPLRSDKSAEYIRKNVPGVVIPDAVINRLRRTPKQQKQAEGRRICTEIIQQVREIDGVAGVHVMAFRQEEMVAQIVVEAGLLPRPGMGFRKRLRQRGLGAESYTPQ